MQGYNFGVELEMFNRGEGGGDDDYYEDDDEYGEEREPSDRVSRALRIFREANVCDHDRIHYYHCECDMCDYDRQGALMAAQADSTVGVEFISRILSTSSNNDMVELQDLQAAYSDVLAATRWLPDGVGSFGNHIHVSHPMFDTTPMIRAKASVYMQALMATNGEAWRDRIATGGCSQVRGYNGGAPTLTGFTDTGMYDNGSWVRQRHSTIEIRVWNTPREPERLLVHPAISVGLCEWAHTEAESCELPSARAIADEVALSGPRHHRRVASIVRKIWPHRRSADLAAELLAA